MKRILKWFGIALGGLAVFLLVAVFLIYVVSERVLNKTYDIPLSQIIVPTDTLSIVEGERLSIIRGCYQGCHGEGLEGGLFIDSPGVVHIVSPNLTRVVPEYTDAELARVIRRGIKRDGTSVLPTMPSPMFYHLSDEDLGAIIAFLRNASPVEGPLGEIKPGLWGRLSLASGQLTPAAEMIDGTQPRMTVPKPTEQVGYGKYLAATVCSKCHGADLRGGLDGLAPSLAAMAAAYSAENFVQFMRTGVSLSGRKLKLMSRLARGRFSHLTDAEIGALHAYLVALIRGEEDIAGTE